MADDTGPAPAVPRHTSGYLRSNATLKAAVLFAMVAQNTLVVIAMRYSRLVSEEPGDTDKASGSKTNLYIPSTLILLTEVCKLIMCLAVLAVSGELMEVLKEFITVPRSVLLSLVPSLVFLTQNTLIYVAISNLPAAVFQVTYQLKLLTSALLTVIVLRRTLSALRWLAVIVLFIGVVFVQLPAGGPIDESRSDENSKHLFGLAAASAGSLLSSIAGLYMEVLMKQSSAGAAASLWAKNVPLAAWSVLFALPACWFTDGDAISSHGFFAGYTAVVWCVLALQAAGGLLVAAVLKHADNVLKGFATAVSTVASSVAAIFLFDFEPSMNFVFGASLVIGSVFLYNAGAEGAPCDARCTWILGGSPSTKNRFVAA
eukprot:TRINITY_DN42980_c0_g1_i1.p1 TRINITY_DN42980_c0_g1~~TRINITY_DN42980_c0_g1_i1.p1  ORF type:complete len:387 (+),score=63.43 TRINITY_DN42980_c0_g1_i1:46-1161(+)